MRSRPTLSLVALVALTAVATAGFGRGEEQPGKRPDLPRGAERVQLDPDRFTTKIDNPYLPMTPGSRWIYRESDGHGTVQRVVVTVTKRTKVIAGITARVVHDRVTEHGVPVEDTFDWYAQDVAGNVWYLGEDTREFEQGKVVSTKGSWQTGVDGAQAGVVMPARPRVGMRYRQEHYARQAEDRAKVLSRTEQAEVPFGRFRHALLTKEWTPLEPDVLEYKLYARGVGQVLAVAVSGGTDREELVRFRKRRP